MTRAPGERAQPSLLGLCLSVSYFCTRCRSMCTRLPTSSCVSAARTGAETGFFRP